MTYLTDLLPLLRGWHYEVKDIDNVPTYTVKEEILRVTDKVGWVVWCSAVINNKNAEIKVFVDGYCRADMTPAQLFAAGVTIPNSAGYWFGTYNDIASVYTVFFTPIYPYPFKESVIISLVPPAGGNVTVISYGHVLVIIDDIDEFKKSLKELGI